MTIVGNTLLVEFGRVGTNPQKRSYSASQYRTKYNEKIKKGYEDVTNMKATEVSKKEFTMKEEFKSLYELLTTFSRDFTSQNYNISAEAVTPLMLENAQRILNHLNFNKDLPSFNDDLVKLFKIIPRKMGKVREYLASDLSQVKDIIAREQDTLDVMAGQVKTQVTIESGDLHEQFNIDGRPCTDEELKMIKAKLGDNAKYFETAWKVTNYITRNKFETYPSFNPKTDLLWHGSRNENWWGIFTQGLVLRPTNAVITGKMFGLGTYFADKAQKSLGYSSMSGSYWTNGNSDIGLLALYSVNTGNQLELEYSDSSLTFDSLRKKGKYDSVFAKAGPSLRNNEFIVYHENQSTIEFLVKLKR